MMLSGMYKLMKTLALLKSNPVVHILFLIKNVAAIGEEVWIFFLINLAHVPDLGQPEHIPCKTHHGFSSALVFLFYIYVYLRGIKWIHYLKNLQSEPKL